MSLWCILSKIKWLDDEISKSEYERMINKEITNNDWEAFSTWYETRYIHIQTQTQSVPFWAESLSCKKNIFDEWKNDRKP